MFKVSALSTLGLLASQALARGVPSRRPIQKRSVPSQPVFVVYSDDWVTGALPAISDIEGCNVFALAFLWDGSAQDQADNWETLGSAAQESAIANYHNNGIYVVVSAFGSTPTPTTSGENAATVGAYMAEWVIQQNLDGIDLDYEDLSCFDNSTCNPEAWIETWTQTVRQTLPVGQYILSHAPLAPWFSPTFGWANGGYLAIHHSVGDLVDWYNVQFYNQNSAISTTEYATCEGLLTASSAQWPETAVFQIAANGVTLDKIVIGKPATTPDETNGGYIAPATLAGCIQQASEQGWNAGIMVWQYPDATSQWITEVRADVWPAGSSLSDSDLSTANEDEVPGAQSGATWGSGVSLTKTQTFPPKGTFAYSAVAALPIPTMPPKI